MIFATWNPVKALMGAYIFGGIDALGFRIQTKGIEISPFFLSMLPLYLHHSGDDPDHQGNQDPSDQSSRRTGSAL